MDGCEGMGWGAGREGWVVSGRMRMGMGIGGDEGKMRVNYYEEVD